MPDAVRQTLNDSLIGAWDLEVTRGDERSAGIYTASWSPGEDSIRIEMANMGDDGLSHASELMGWDAESNCLTLQGFGSESGSWTIRFTDTSSNKWKGTWKGYFQGKPDGSPCTMELKGDSFEYRDTTDGQPLVIKATRRQASPVSKQWRRYLKGEWTYEISPMNDKGTVTWRIATKGNALVGRFVGDNGVVGMELSGHQKDKARELVTGFSSDGGCWTIEITEQTVDEIKGNNFGVLPDGKTFRGQFVGKKVDENHYEWNFTGNGGDGNPLTMTGKYERKTE